jgi:hypothetical protein
MYSANPIIASLCCQEEQRCYRFSGSERLSPARFAPAMLAAEMREKSAQDESVFRWAATPGERQPLHVGCVLKNTRLLQGFAARSTVRHGACLLERHQRLHMQVVLQWVFDLLDHCWKLGRKTTPCLFGIGRWNRDLTGISGTKRRAGRFQCWRCPMSKEKPTDDPRQQTDWGTHKQTDKPWKGNPEKEQRPGKSKPDLEKWHETNTH